MPTHQERRAPGDARKYRFGFSLLGFIAVLVPMIPNGVWALVPGASDALAGNHSPWPVVDVVGTVAQSAMIALLILLVTRRELTTGGRVLGAVAIMCLAAYLLLWVLYFTVDLTPLMILMMAVLPSVYFICVALYLENYPAVVLASLFALIHIATTAMNFL